MTILEYRDNIIMNLNIVDVANKRKRMTSSRRRKKFRVCKSTLKKRIRESSIKLCKNIKRFTRRQKHKLQI